MVRMTVRRTFDGSRFTLADLRSLAVAAHEAGLDDTAVVGIEKRYVGGRKPSGGWRIECTVNGEADGNITLRRVLDRDDLPQAHYADEP